MRPRGDGMCAPARVHANPHARLVQQLSNRFQKKDFSIIRGAGLTPPRAAITIWAIAGGGDRGAADEATAPSHISYGILVMAH